LPRLDDIDNPQTTFTSQRVALADHRRQGCGADQHEADVTVGTYSRRARQSGMLYSVSSGDEPGCLMDLYDFVTTLGYQPVVIGKGKNNPLDISATPSTVAESARRAGKDPFQVASYVDGTKTMFEMTCAANATGCPPMQRGMIGPEADLKTVSQIFALSEDGGLARFAGAVDFVQGSSMSGGVFATVRIDDSRICTDLEYLKVGKGRYYTFFRPYHLWFLEAPLSFARAPAPPHHPGAAAHRSRCNDGCQARLAARGLPR
jgi:predicted homoserine dehydrogenase-like protein